MPHKDINERRKYNTEYRERNKEKLKNYMEDWKKKNPNHNKGSYAKYIAKNPDYYKMRNLRKYNLTIEQYDSMLWNQNYKCAICKTSSHGKKGWQIDHCHKTDRVRGILCTSCNVGIGHFRENIDIFNEAIKYLSK